jgi:citrate lyase subunit beta/citryl-CoA lyase
VTALSGNERIAAARSFLFVPGDRPDRFAKAGRSGADLVIVDLEDAVAEADKAGARRAAVEWLHHDGRAVVRINSDPATAHADLDALAGAPGLVAVMVPKAEEATALHVASNHGTVLVIALIESAVGLSRARQLALHPSTCRLALGSLDLAVDLGISDDSAAMATAGYELVLASRLAGLPAPISTVTTEVGDGRAAAAAAARARREGFGGKLCIHPLQVAAVNTALHPSASEISWAHRVIAVSREGSLGVVDGAMVDRPVVERARRILAAAGIN